MALEPLIPFRELDSMERRMRRLFEGWGFAPTLVPAADIYETPEELVVEIEVPGFEEKDLEVEVTDHVLTVKGTRKEVKEEKDKTFRLHERLDREFMRRFELPPEADTTKVKAVFTKGVLELHTPKTVEAKAHRIPIAAK
jgi:HSP20 family protein